MVLLGDRHVIADQPERWADQLSSFTVDLMRDDGVSRYGHAAHVLGGPVKALRFLVDELVRYPVCEPLRPGELVITVTRVQRRLSRSPEGAQRIDEFAHRCPDKLVGGRIPERLAQPCAQVFQVYGRRRDVPIVITPGLSDAGRPSCACRAHRRARFSHQGHDRLITSRLEAEFEWECVRPVDRRCGAVTRAGLRALAGMNKFGRYTSRWVPEQLLDTILISLSWPHAALRARLLRSRDLRL
jgi:hypothetical protein